MIVKKNLNHRLGEITSDTRIKCWIFVGNFERNAKLLDRKIILKNLEYGFRLVYLKVVIVSTELVLDFFHRRISNC